MITSPQNPKLKLVRSLQGRAKARRKENAFLVEGVRLFEEAVAAKWKQQQQAKALKDYFEKIKTNADIQVLR